jgi:predicted Zn-dependent peptidase
MISSILSDGKSSRLYKKLVDDKKIALQTGAFSNNQEDYGTYFLYGLPMGTNTSADLLKEIDEEIVKIQTELISEKDFQKLQNKFDNNYVNSNSGVEGIAENLATYYLLYKDVNLINTEIELIHSITREEIRAVAKKYLNPNQRLVLDYIPTSEKAQN